MFNMVLATSPACRCAAAWATSHAACAAVSTPLLDSGRDVRRRSVASGCKPAQAAGLHCIMMAVALAWPHPGLGLRDNANKMTPRTLKAM